jgi:hypothetical protein
MSKHLQKIFHCKIYQKCRYHEYQIKIKTAWPSLIFKKSPWETTKFLNCPKIRMFRKDTKFLLDMWHPWCYSIKNFDQRRDRNQDQGNIPSSRHQRDQKDQRGLKNLQITHKRAGNKKGYRMVLNGNIKGHQRTRCKKGLLWHKYAQRWKSK